MSAAAPLSAPDWRELETLLGAAALRPRELAVCPASVEQAAALARWAAGRGCGLVPWSSASPAFSSAASIPSAGAGPGLRVDLAGLQAVRFYEPQDLTAGFEAGIGLAAAAAALAARGQFLPLDVARAAGRNLGSALGGHAFGPLRQAYGSLRDFTIGIEFISGRGEIVHAGGRVVKNVAGYDLMKLLIGSRGSLGLIVAANFRVFPRPALTATLLLRLPDLASAEHLRAAMQASWLRPLSFELATQAPDSAPAAAPDGAGFWAAIRFSGSEAVLARCRKDLERLAGGLGLPMETVPAETEAEFWQAWNAWPQSLPGAWLKLAAAPALAAGALAACAALLPGLRFQGRLGLGLFSLHLPELVSAPLAECRRRLRRLSGPGWSGGADAFLTWPDAATAADRWGELGQDRELMRQLKMELDPHRIFPDPFGLVSE